MRRLLPGLISLILLLPASALQLSIDRNTYSPGEDGLATVTMDVPQDYTSVIIEVEVLDSEGNMVYGDVLNSQIPGPGFDPQVRETHDNLQWTEVPENGTVQRSIYFRIPPNAPEGDYTVVARAFYENSQFDSDVGEISIVGGVFGVDALLIVFIFVLIVAVVIWREV